MSTTPKPYQNSRIDVAMSIYHDPATRSEVLCRFANAMRMRVNANRAIEAMLSVGQLIDDKGVLTLPESMHEFCADLEQSRDSAKKVKVPLTPPRAVPEFKPMDTSMYNGVLQKIRANMAFKNGLSSPVPFRGLDQK